jgi:ubiquinone/menaquinone biosynthesis C-methylase UbiE
MIVRRLRLCPLILLLVLISGFAAAQDTAQKECTELAVLMQWHPGDTVADIGAGNGKLTSLTAERIGPSGRVYSTEMDSEKLAALEQLSTKRTNITPIKASDSNTNLPDQSCDSIYMRLVYHHFTKPSEMDSSLFRSLKHGGRLAIVDEEPSKGSTIPDGVPKNRRGHGIPEKVLITELKHAGFKVQTVEKDWPGGDSSHQMYCVVFVKR